MFSSVPSGRRPSEEGVLWPHLPSSQIPTPLPIGAVHVQVQGWCETSPNSPFFQIWVPAAGWQWMRYGNPRTTRLLGRHWDEVSSLYRPSPGAACGPDPPLPQAGPPLVSFTPQPNCPLPNWEPAQRCTNDLKMVRFQSTFNKLPSTNNDTVASGTPRQKVVGQKPTNLNARNYVLQSPRERQPS